MAHVLDHPEPEPKASVTDLVTCPTCDSDILNVHGVHTCSGCAWLESTAR